MNNQETWFVYGFDGELVAEYAATGAAATPQKEYAYRNGQLLVTAEPPATPPVNVAATVNGATATASSTYSGFAASGAINGDRKGLFVWQNGFWSTAGAGFPAWLEVQFNGSKTISEIDVVTTQDNYNAPVEPTETMTFSSYGLTGYEVQYWNASAWVTISGGSVSGNNKVWKKFSFTPITTTKIRVVSNGSPDGYSRLTEVEAWTGPSPAPRYNLALGKPATASSNWVGWPPSSLVNGDRKSLNAGTDGGWVDAAPANTFPDWAQVDFGTNQTVSEIDVFTLQDNYAGSTEPTEAMTFTQWGLTGYEVQYWDGGNWVTVSGGSVTGNNKIWRKFTFSPISTSKIRVLTNASLDGYSRLTEIEAYGPAETTGVGGLHWLITDHLSTPRMILDQSGSLANMKRHDYLPFGEELFAPTGGRTTAQGYAGGDDVRQQFTLKERDNETGLDYFFARYYSATQGRFTSSDEFTGGPDELYYFAEDAADNPTFYADLTNPQSLNKYQYTYNDPLNMTDGDGHCPICPFIIGGAAVAAYILLSPQTVHAPTPNDTYRERSASSAAQIVNLGAAEALGGPILNKVLSKVSGRSAASAERAALRAEQERLVRVLHKRELSFDPATKGFRAAEGEAGYRLEAQIGRRLTRDRTGAVDFVDSKGTTYELVGAGLKSKHFDFEAVTREIRSHLGKADRVAVDVSGLTRSQADSVRNFVNGLAREESSRIRVLR